MMPRVLPGDSNRGASAQSTREASQFIIHILSRFGMHGFMSVYEPSSRPTNRVKVGYSCRFNE